ncbi:HAD-IB family hydrolase [Candidatus Saccharibacteria bacterium]|nr:HAD-IB family hydrolase [Candidatus Saccharibacteria bacterium]
MRKFAVFDIDGTLVRWQLYHAVADRLVHLGYIKPHVFEDVHKARMTWKRREHGASFRNYELQLVGLYTNILLSLAVTQFKEAADLVFDEYKDQVYTYTRDLIDNLKAEGYLMFAISGSQEEIVKKLAIHYGFDDFVGRVDEHKNGRFTGKSTTPIFNKDAALRKLVKRHGAVVDGSYGVGDSYSDIKMLQIVDNPIAFNPEKELFEHAKVKGWMVVIERKNVIYELENHNGKYNLAKANTR